MLQKKPENKKDRPRVILPEIPFLRVFPMENAGAVCQMLQIKLQIIGHYEITDAERGL
jgi:hypothetical protein